MRTPAYSPSSSSKGKKINHHRETHPKPTFWKMYYPYIWMYIHIFIRKLIAAGYTLAFSLLYCSYPMTPGVVVSHTTLFCEIKHSHTHTHTYKGRMGSSQKYISMVTKYFNTPAAMSEVRKLNCFFFLRVVRSFFFCLLSFVSVRRALGLSFSFYMRVCFFLTAFFSLRSVLLSAFCLLDCV